MTIPSVGGLNPIGSIGASDPISPLNPVSIPSLGVIGADSSSPTALDTNSAPITSGSASGFASVLSDSLQNLQNLQTRSDQLAVRAADGDLNDVHDYTIAATEASLATQLTVAVRDKALAAFSEIMRMG